MPRRSHSRRSARVSFVAASACAFRSSTIAVSPQRGQPGDGYEWVLTRADCAGEQCRTAATRT